MGEERGTAPYVLHEFEGRKERESETERQTERRQIKRLTIQNVTRRAART